MPSPKHGLHAATGRTTLLQKPSKRSQNPWIKLGLPLLAALCHCTIPGGRFTKAASAAFSSLQWILRLTHAQA